MAASKELIRNIHPSLAIERIKKGEPYTTDHYASTIHIENECEVIAVGKKDKKAIRTGMIQLWDSYYLHLSRNGFYFVK